MSRVILWQNLDITYFDLSSIKADKRVIKEYELDIFSKQNPSHQSLNFQEYDFHDN